MIKIGTRIPEKYFMAVGAGQSDYGPGKDHWETGSYDLALEEAGIENFSIVPYTSVVPPQAIPITIQEAKRAGLFHHGAVLEVIMASVNGVAGDHLCAGVGHMKVWKKDGDEEILIGGFAAEYEGKGSVAKARKLLQGDLERIFERRYGKKPGYKCGDFQFTIKDMIVDKKYGTVLAAMAFVTYLLPEVADE